MRARLVILAVAAVVWILDALSKQWALTTLPGHPVALVGDFLQLQLTSNPGAAFSMGTGATWIFTLLASIVIIVIIVIAARVTNRWWLLGFGGLLGGAAGNLTDRLTRPPAFGLGHVVDFIATPNFPVFNVADMSIVGSVALMFIASARNIPMHRDDHE